MVYIYLDLTVTSFKSRNVSTNQHHMRPQKKLEGARFCLVVIWQIPVWSLRTKPPAVDGKEVWGGGQSLCAW